MACGPAMLRIAQCIWMLCALVIFICITTFHFYDEYKNSLNGKFCKDVMTESGLVRGCVDAGGNYFAFLGVPYAAPPTGTLRFKPPVKPDPWKKVLEADRFVTCVEDENCLVVNIFSPVKSFSRPLSVFFFIHGGSFHSGYGPHSIEQLTKHNIIVVTVNYRLGILGFLCLGTEIAPGNAGMKDQVAALKWVKQNIANFGGDPNKVTIGGKSAGGAAVDLLVLSKQGKGLFHQAIVDSGSATAVWATDLDPLLTAYKFAKKLGIAHNTNISALGNYYQRLTKEELSRSIDRYTTYETDDLNFGPCVEKINDSNAFMTEAPYHTLIKENYKKVPMIYFFASQEGLDFFSHTFYNQTFTARMQANFSDFLPADLTFDSAKTRESVAQNIKDFYFGNRTIRENVMGFLNFHGDHLVLHGLLNSVEINSHNQNPVYLMEFAYKGDLGFYDKFYDFLNEAAHADTFRYVLVETKRIKKERDKKAVERISTLVANFVKFGNPTPEKTHLLPVIWPRVIPGNISCLYMKEEFKVINKPHWKAKRFWDLLYSKYRRKILRPGE